MIDRCECCGSWEAECVFDTAAPGCGCARCACVERDEATKTLAEVQAELNEAKKERDSLKDQMACAQAFRDVAVSERNLARFSEDAAKRRLREVEAERDAALAEGERVRGKGRRRDPDTGFASVADEIRDLAERAGANSQEVSDLIERAGLVEGRPQVERDAALAEVERPWKTPRDASPCAADATETTSYGHWLVAAIATSGGNEKK